MTDKTIKTIKKLEKWLIEAGKIIKNQNEQIGYLTEHIKIQGRIINNYHLQTLKSKQGENKNDNN